MSSLKKLASLLSLASVLGLFVFFSYINEIQAANPCTSTGTGNWNTAATWTSCGGGIPTSLDSVTILTGHIVTVDTAAVANTVTINANTGAGGNGISISSGKSLAVTGAVTLNIPTVATTDLIVGAGTLTAGSIAIPGSTVANRFATVSVSTGTVMVFGSVTFSGTASRARYISTGASITNIAGDFGAGGTLTTSGTGTFNFNGGAAQIIGAYSTYNNVQINNTAGDVTFGGATTIGGTLLVNTGTLNMGGISPTVIGDTTINGILKISSTVGTKTFHDITIANGGAMNFTAAEIITHLGSLTVNGTGTITGTTGVWAFQKVGGGSIGGTAGSIAITSATFTTNYTSSIPTTYSGTVTVNGATVALTNNSTLTVTTALSGTGQLTQGVNGILNIGGTSAIAALDASASSNEVHYTSTAANQTIKAVTSSYRHLFIEKSGRIGTLAAAIAITGNLSVTAGTLADGGFQITGNSGGTFTLSAGTTLTLGTVATATSFPTAFILGNIALATTSTVNYNSNLVQTISQISAYGNLTTTATGAVTKTADGAITVNGNLTNGINNVLADGGFIVTVKGNSIMAGTHTGAGKVLLTGGTGVHSVSGAGSYTNVELDDSNGVTQSGTTNIGGVLTITNGTWTVGANTISVIGTTSISGTLSVTSTTGTKTFGDITIASGGLMTFSAVEAVTINGNFTVNGTGAVTGTSGIWTFQKVGGGSIGGTAPSLTIFGNTTFATPYSILMPYTVNTMTVNSGVTEANASTMTIRTSLAGTGTLTQSANATLNIGGGATITTLDASINPNVVSYASTTIAQTVKSANYYNLIVDKSAQTATVSSTTNVLGNLTLTSGVLSLGSSILTVTGVTDIYGTIRDVNNSGSATFEGLVTVYPGGAWDGNVAESCDFNFLNGFSFNGMSFVTGGGLYTFSTNNQSITGASSFAVKNLVVTGIALTNSSLGTVGVDTALSGTGEFVQGTNANLSLGGDISHRNAHRNLKR